jgi:hypothetical protein
MVESSKILTVSYGTFSCTLEGFDDSFGTMKAIAEYFRDLAQGDRYFGAEPPAPDAEMLTRIAEKEIERRVEARADESGIVLRAVDAAKVAAVTPAMPPVASPPSEDAVADVDTDTLEEMTESTQSATADMDGDVAGPEAGEDDSPTLVASSPAAADYADTPMDDEMDISAPAVSFADMAPAAIETAPAHPDSESVAAKLQRIRAVVSAGAAPAADTQDAPLTESFTAEDEVAQDAWADDADDAEDNAIEAGEDDVAEAAAEEVAEDVEADVLADTEDASEAEAFDDIAEDADEAADEIAEDHVAAADEAEEVADVADFDNADTLAEDTAEVEAEEVEAEAAEAEAEAEEVAAETEEAEANSEVEAAADAEDEAQAEEAPKQNFRARILRVAKKTTAMPIADVATDAAQTAAETAEVAAEDAPAIDLQDIDAEEAAEFASADALAQATLSDEDEAALLADLAAVEAETAEDAPEVTDTVAEDENVTAEVEEETAEDAVDDALEAAAAEDDTPVVRSRSLLPDADDAAMSRIMDQADEQLSEPAGSRRRSAIAQLKAAVAATEAARQLGDKSNDAATKESAFRDDLQDVVRPTSQALPRTEERSARPRPAPLKLVASQRVDENGEEVDAAPVLPRRVASEAKMDGRSFADFAAEMGATELPDLLEAAAAYTAFVEGVEDFSRPQIMKKVQSSAKEEFSREDGLRSFGTLLRQGRISKVRNGRFQISDQTRFKPEQKAG